VRTCPLRLQYSGAVLIAAVADPPAAIGPDHVVLVVPVEDSCGVVPVGWTDGINAPGGQVDDRPSAVGALVDTGNIDIRHQMGARMDLGSAHEGHNFVDSREARTSIEDLPDRVVREDVAQLLGFESVQRIGITCRQLDDV
jgi:hypothetical protein